jgi:phytoene/squalene synthetase
MMTNKEQFIITFESIDFTKITDHPNILIAARFWDQERYQAARTCYRFMRTIDDLIDNHKAEFREIAGSDREQFTKDVYKWLDMLHDGADSSPFGRELTSTVQRFRIPRRALEDFAGSMLYDVTHDGFATLNDFIHYSGGASVAPATIFVHLAGLQDKNGMFDDPPFDVRSAALPCAMFSYFVHIIRDFRKDQLNNLSYFADEVIARHHLSRSDMNNIANGAPIPAGFRAMMREYLQIADSYRSDTLRVMEKICPLLEPRYRLSLEVIFDLYLMVFERIDPDHGTFTTEELNPSPSQTQERVRGVIERFKE